MDNPCIARHTYEKDGCKVVLSAFRIDGEIAYHGTKYENGTPKPLYFLPESQLHKLQGLVKERCVND